MLGKRHNPDEIVAKRRQVDVMTPQRAPLSEVIRLIGVSEVTCHRWRNEFSSLKLSQLKRSKQLKLQNIRLRKAVSDLTRDMLILSEALRGSWSKPGGVTTALSARTRRSDGNHPDRSSRSPALSSGRTENRQTG